MVFLLSLLCAWLYARYITRPIVRLSKISKQMAELDFSGQCSTGREDELGCLAQNLNSLSASLSTALNDLQTANQQLKTDIEKEQELERQRVDFFSAASHELKTPLTVISGYAQLTGIQLADNNINKEIPDNLKTIQQEAQRLGDMVTRLMEYSYGRKSAVEFSRIIVPELLENVNAIATPVCLKQHNAVKIVTAPCADIHGNFEMLLQILINLVVNANKNTQNGTITISASDQEREDAVLFRVSDTGNGISPEILPHIFDEGFSASGSSGLGLTICREAVEAHGGEIWVERTGPEGSVFAFTVLKEEEQH